MADEFEEQDWVKIGVASALARQAAADQRELLDDLGRLLEGTLPEAVVERKGGLFSPGRTHSIRIDLGANRYVLQDAGRGPLQAKRIHVVRGIALKTEEIAIDEWL